jgi:hypothetical protein
MEVSGFDPHIRLQDADNGLEHERWAALQHWRAHARLRQVVLITPRFNSILTAIVCYYIQSEIPRYRKYIPFSSLHIEESLSLFCIA